MVISMCFITIYIYIYIYIYTDVYIYMGIYIYIYMGCLKKTCNQCQPRGYNFDHDGCAPMD